MMLPSARNCSLLLGATALAFAGAPALAMSRMGTATVNVVDGLPCFSLLRDRETRNGLPLSVLLVSEVRSPDGMRTLPAELWRISRSDTAPRHLLRPEACIRYGEAPAGMVQRTLMPLKLFHPYHVSIKAGDSSYGTVAHGAQFCLTTDAAGKVRANIAPPESKRHLVADPCARPLPAAE